MDQYNTQPLAIIQLAPFVINGRALFRLQMRFALDQWLLFHHLIDSSVFKVSLPSCKVSAKAFWQLSQAPID